MSDLYLSNEMTILSLSVSSHPFPLSCVSTQSELLIRIISGMIYISSDLSVGISTIDDGMKLGIRLLLTILLSGNSDEDLANSSISTTFPFSLVYRGFDAAVADMEVGQIIDVHLMPEEAYGMADPNAIFTMEIAQLPGSEDLTVGQQVYLSNQFGQPFPVKVTAKDEKNITFDANHEMAGKELNFKIELVEVK